MKKEYKEFIINQLYGLIDGSPKTLEQHMNYMFPKVFNRNDVKITVIKSNDKLTEIEPTSWIGTILVTITIDNKIFSCKRDFEEEYKNDVKHPDYESDNWFYESDKCFAYIKRNKLLNNI